MDNREEPQENKTHFASSGKASDEDILKQYDVLAGNQLIRMISDAIPDVAMILSKERQVVYENKALMELAGGSGSGSFIGKRPGEILECLNANSLGSGCGTTESCRYCGAINAILECQRTGQSSTKECRISSETNGQSFAYDLQVNASPFQFNGNEYVIFSIKDISDQKRRKVLERIFFHDVLNNATGINGILLAIKGSCDADEMSAFIDVAEKASNDLIEDLISQRSLSAAENGDLQINVSRFSSVQILHEISAYLSHHEVASGKRIFVDPFSHAVQIETDSQLLKRVLVNIVKNALEASPRDAVITLGSRVNNKTIVFTINNPVPMPVEVQKQIFQRSFSTKGTDRGIGTYSVKLLTTKYLEGTVDFESDINKGTTFIIKLPLGIQY